MKGYNHVQCDRQWIRRVMREENTLISAINGGSTNGLADAYTGFTYQPNDNQSGKFKCKLLRCFVVRSKSHVGSGS